MSELIGASPEAIDKAEDRSKFKEAMTKIGLASARSGIAHSLDEALGCPEKDRLSGHYPPVVHAGRHRWRYCVQRGRIRRDLPPAGWKLSPTSELLIEESLIGWKEYEMEVVRDKADNCIIVCSIENSRSDGRPHRRLHYGGAGTDADRQGIPAHAQRLDVDSA